MRRGRTNGGNERRGEDLGERPIVASAIASPLPFDIPRRFVDREFLQRLTRTRRMPAGLVIRRRRRRRSGGVVVPARGSVLTAQMGTKSGAASQLRFRGNDMEDRHRVCELTPPGGPHCASSPSRSGKLLRPRRSRPRRSRPRHRPVPQHHPSQPPCGPPLL